MAEYELYDAGVTFTYEWKLTGITSPDGATVTLTYTTPTTTNKTRDVSVGIYQYPDPGYNPIPADVLERNIYRVTEVTEKGYISTITASTGPKIEFIGKPLTTIKVSDTRRGSTATEQYIKTFTLAYDEKFLISVTENSGCIKLPPYKFSYNGKLSTRWGTDLWGYPNGSNPAHFFPKLYIYPDEPASERYRYTPIPGASNEVILPGVSRASTNEMLLGVLRTIKTPEGGTTTFTFEPNQYLDTRINQNINAGGVRIKNISYFDGFNLTPTQKTFEYVDPTTGLSSGRLIRRPQYAIPQLKWSGNTGTKDVNTPGLTSAQKWQYLTLRTSYDLAEGDDTKGSVVGYSITTVRRPGAGAARYEYDIPAIYGNFVKGAWKATTNKLARAAVGSIGIIPDTKAGGPWTFLNVPNPNFDYERGLTLKKSEYNEAGKLVRKIETTYQYIYRTGTTPTKVYGLRYNRYPESTSSNFMYFYGRYFLLTDALKVPKKETVTEYDITDNTGNTYITESTEYFYSSANHKLLTQIKQTVSDGNIYTTRLKYPKDYTLAGNGAADAVAIGTLQSSWRHGIVVEQIQTLKKASDSTRVISGTVNKFDPMGMGRPMRRSTWQLKTNPTIRIDSFYNSAVVTAGSQKYFKIDSRYERVDSVLSYTTLGDVKARYNPISRQTAVTGYGYSSTLPIVQLASTSDGTAAFSDFETTTGFEFSSGTVPYFGTGRSGVKAFYAGVQLYKVLTKPSASNYILAFWIKSNASVTFNLDLKTSSGTALSPVVTHNFTIPSTGSEFKYFQRIIPIPGHVPSSFRVELKSTLTSSPSGTNGPGNITPSLLPVIDDVFFYPDNASMSAVAYTIPFGPSVASSGTGEAAWYDYDLLGRPTIAYDRNKDIVKRTAYNYTAESPLVADFTPQTVYMNAPTTFNATTSDCVTDATYEWDWGSGYVSGTAAQSYTFTTAGTFAVKLRVTSATWGIKTVTKNVTVTNDPITVNVCVNGGVDFFNGVVQAYGNCGTSNPNNPIFSILNTPLSGETFSYVWKRRDYGYSTWTIVGTGNTYTSTVNNTTAMFEVMCELTTSYGRSGQSRPFLIDTHLAY